MEILNKIFSAIEEHTWFGRQLHKLALYRDSHPGISMLFLPLDIAFLTIIIVFPVLFIVVLAGLISWPVKRLGGDDIEVLLFGLAVIGVAAFLITRHINKIRREQ